MGLPGNSTESECRRAYWVRYAGAEARYFDSSAIPPRNVDLRGPQLKTGDPMDREQFPVVFESS